MAQLGVRLVGTAGVLCRAMRKLATWCIVVGALSGPATAQILSGPERAQLEAKKAQLFQQMLNNPANLDVTFAYAEASAQLGDNEAAVAALERMLLLNPNLAAVDLELGALYFRMGSFQIARTYLDKALAGKPSPEIRARAEQYLSEIAPELSPHRFNGLVLFGAQYQSDANAAPDTGLINSPIGPVLLNNQFVKQGGFDVFANGTGLYSYDLGTQNGDRIEVGGTGFANHYFQFTRLDLDLVEVTAGPRFGVPTPAAGIKTSSVKPYLIVNEVALGLSQYFHTYGGGIEATALLPNDLGLRAAFEFRQKSFSNAPSRPLSTGLDGSDKLVSLALKQPLTANSEVNFEFDYLDQSTRFSFYANEAYALSGGYRIRYDDPTRTLSLPWETAVYFGFVLDNYDAPDPCCNTSTDPAVVTLSTRHDRRWRVGLTQTFQVSSNIAIVAQFQHDLVNSNLPLYAYSSNSVLVGPQIRF
jgi:tetratricopeptide (TPR) repeat protein